jgi:glutamate-ammonia-ligase adenylyltransferase
VSGSDKRDVLSGLGSVCEVGLMTKDDQSVLSETYDLFWRIQVASKLLTEQQFDPDAAGASGVEFLLRLAGCGDLTALQTKMNDLAAASQSIIDGVLPEPKEDADERGHD